jgi:hypothetical protein
MTIRSVSENEIDRQLFTRLRENEIDLQTELADLGEEIATREIRITEVLAALRTTREHMRRLLWDAFTGEAA